MVNKKQIGVHDLPINIGDHDKFGVEPYIGALSDFITECQTPITIALQGGWGTGKTSFMNLINKELKPVKELGVNKEEGNSYKNNYDSDYGVPIVTVNFNTWQYTQFNLQENLGVSFLSYMVQRLSHDLDNKDLIEKAKKALKSVSIFGAHLLLSRYGMSMPEGKRNENETVMDPAQAIESLKSSINCIVKQHLDKYREADKEPRLVIFIDDLDRLNPRIAVELLEVIKLFLDIEGCVFVLAVDNRVIEEGIKDAKSTSVEKTRNFLDKMIQVPFKVPVETYNYDKFLQENLADIYKDAYMPKELEKLIRNSVGSNPRALKRLINNYYLNNKVNARLNDKKIFKPEDQSVLIAIICMQLSYQPLYVTILNSEQITIVDLINASERTEEGENDLASKLKAELERYKDLQLYDEDIEGNLARYITFLSLLQELLLSIKLKQSKKNEIEPLEEEDLNIFIDILNQSELTSGTQNVTVKKGHLYSDEVEEINLETFVNDMNNYKLESKPFSYNIAGKSEEGLQPKEAFTNILKSIITEREDIDKMRDLEGMKQFQKTIYYPLLEDEIEKEKLRKKYKTIIFEFEGEQAEIGYHFNAQESARQLYRMLEYLKPGENWDIKLKTRKKIEN